MSRADAAFATTLSITNSKNGGSGGSTSGNNNQQQQYLAAPKNEQDDRLAKWSERWKNNMLGWHLDNVHESLVKYGKTYILPGDDLLDDGKDACLDDEIDNGGNTVVRVLVPLCGKTVDMAFLASQTSVQVVGVDGIHKALEEFAKEQSSLEIESVEALDKYDRFQGRDITLLKGDFFDLDETAAGGRFDAVWDRASIIAIQPELREKYVETISKLIKPGGTILLAALERRTGSEEGKNAGPPFSVSEKEVRRLYEGQDWVESVVLLEEIDQFARRPADKERFEKSGVTSMYELIFLIKAKE